MADNIGILTAKRPRMAAVRAKAAKSGYNYLITFNAEPETPFNEEGLKEIIRIRLDIVSVTDEEGDEIIRQLELTPKPSNLIIPVHEIIFDNITSNSFEYNHNMINAFAKESYETLNLENSSSKINVRVTYNDFTFKDFFIPVIKV